MAANNRYERLFWEVQLCQVDDMARQLVSMRSVFERRMRHAGGAVAVRAHQNPRPLARNLVRDFGAGAGAVAPVMLRVWRPVIRQPKKKIKVLIAFVRVL